MKEIIYYEKENWNIPFLDFLKKLDIQLSSKIFHKTELLLIGKLWDWDVKYIKEKIYELRIRDENNYYRVFYFSILNDKIVILDWFLKKENKLKHSILNKIIYYKKDYLKRFCKL